MIHRGRTEGAAPIEFALGVAVLLIPSLVLVLSLPTWLERTSLGRTAAREAARAIVTAGTGAEGTAAAVDIVRVIVRNHGVDPDDVALCVAPHTADADLGCVDTLRLERGAAVTVRVTVRMPAIAVPGLGDAAPAFARSFAHTERVDRYRSLP